MCQKQNGLAMNGENPEKIYFGETKIISRLPVARVVGEKRGSKMAVSRHKLLKKNIEKCLFFGLPRCC
jgi:hypothetical protein